MAQCGLAFKARSCSHSSLRLCIRRRARLEDDVANANGLGQVVAKVVEGECRSHASEQVGFDALMPYSVQQGGGAPQQHFLARAQVSDLSSLPSVWPAGSIPTIASTVFRYAAPRPAWASAEPRSGWRQTSGSAARSAKSSPPPFLQFLNFAPDDSAFSTTPLAWSTIMARWE